MFSCGHVLETGLLSHFSPCFLSCRSSGQQRCATRFVSRDRREGRAPRIHSSRLVAGKIKQELCFLSKKLRARATQDLSRATFRAPLSTRLAPCRCEPSQAQRAKTFSPPIPSKLLSSSLQKSQAPQNPYIGLTSTSRPSPSTPPPQPPRAKSTTPPPPLDVPPSSRSGVLGPGGSEGRRGGRR